jgi:hypothetical protein
MDSDTILPPFSDITNTELTGVNIFQGLSGLNFTPTPELISFLSGANIDFSKSTYEVLSAVSAYFSESMSTMLQGLTAPVIHPWDALKMSLFESDYKFSTIEDVVVPEEVTPESIKDKLKEHEQTYRSRVIDCISNRDKYTFVGPFDQVSILSEASGTDCFAVTPDKFKKYIETIETIKSIDPEAVNEDNCLEYITKINYCLADLLARKTVD